MTIYLYVKQCSHCGLKYFGTTIRDPYKYKGSGKDWSNHINKYGRDYVVTLELFSFIDQDEATEFAIAFSYAWNIVESDEWANLCIEAGVRKPPSTKGKSPWNKGKTLPKRSQQHNQRLSNSLKGKSFGPKKRESVEKVKLARSMPIQTPFGIFPSFRNACLELKHYPKWFYRRMKLFPNEYFYLTTSDELY